MTLQEIALNHNATQYKDDFYFQRPHHGYPYYFGINDNIREFGNNDPRICIEDILADDWHIVDMTPEYLAYLRA